MRRDFARWLAVCLLGLNIALGGTHIQASVKAPVFTTQGDPGNGSGGGG